MPMAAAFSFAACPPARLPPRASAASRSRGAGAPRLSRRALGCALAASLVRLQSSAAAAIAADSPPPLPGGAAEFSRVLAARARWGELATAIGAGDVSADEWKSARAFLRAFYSITKDMRVLAKPWDAAVRARAESASRRLEKKIKEMDKPAGDGDKDAFLRLHAEADAIVGEFFDAFAEAATGDMPAEL